MFLIFLGCMWEYMLSIHNRHLGNLVFTLLQWHTVMMLRMHVSILLHVIISLIVE